jgi:hypothetical protein
MTRRQLATWCIDEDWSHDGGETLADTLISDDYYLVFDHDGNPKFTLTPISWPRGTCGGEMKEMGPSVEYKLKDLTLTRFKELVQSPKPAKVPMKKMKF